MPIAPFFTGAASGRRRARRDNQVITYLRDNPGAEPPEIAQNLHRTTPSIARSLRRLETQGRIVAAWTEDGFFNYTGYRLTQNQESTP